MQTRTDYDYRYTGRTPVSDGDAIELAYDDGVGGTEWVPCIVGDALAVQFTAYDSGRYAGCYFYADEGVTWKPIPQSQ